MPGFQISGSGGDLPNTVETLRAYRWQIVELGPITDRMVHLMAKELTLPQIKVESQNILGTTLQYKYAKNVKWEDVQLTFYDYYGLAGKLEDWKKLIYAPDKGIQSHRGYKQRCEFQELDGQGLPLRQIKLTGAWPSQINYGKLSYVNNEIKVIDMTITYDYAEIIEPKTVVRQS